MLLLLLQPVFLVLVSGYLQDVSLLELSQTCLTSLLFGAGSEKREWCGTKRSCPAPRLIGPPDVDHSRVSADRKRSEDTSRPRPNLPASKSQRPHVLSVTSYEDTPLMATLPTLFLLTDHDQINCVVCMETEATGTLTCGHRCLCHNCTGRIILEFGSCPLCRHVIGAPLTT